MRLQLLSCVRLIVRTVLVFALVMSMGFIQLAQAGTYSFMNIPFSWDAPTGATTVTWAGLCTSFPGGDDDYSVVSFPSGFNFTFGGTTYTQVTILSNGMLEFGALTDFWTQYTNATLPITTKASQSPGGSCVNTVPGNLIIPYWVDINTSPNVSGALVEYQLLGSAPNRRFVVTWYNVELYGNSATRYTFQVVLRESASGINGNFEYRYTTGASTGSTATVGVQVSTADYTLYAYNQSFIDTTNGTDILWYPQTTQVSASAYYLFNEASWDGTAGQVLDSSGNLPAQNATSVGSAGTVPSTQCGSGRTGSFPASTSSTVINAVATPITPPSTGTIELYYSSNVAWNAANSQAMLFDATTVAGYPFYLMKTATGALQFTVSDKAGTIATTTSANQTFAANTWQQIAVTWVFLPGTNQAYIQIFLNGSLLTSARYTTTGLLPNLTNALSTLYIGDHRTSGVTPSGGTPNSANGLIEKVKIYTTQINTYQATVDTACVALIDHILIQSSGSGLSCAANTLTVVACQDAACSTNYSAGATGTLSATGTATVNWDGTTGGATGAGFATGSTGKATKNVQVVTPATGTVTFGVNSVTPIPTNAAVCNFGTNSPTNNNCVFTSNIAGFLITNSATGTTAYTIPAQVSGITATGLYLRGLQASTNNPAVCTPALISTTDSVNIGYSCINPSSCSAGSHAAIINPSTNTTTSIVTGGTAVSLNFDSNGSAPFSANYNDVGQITLNANQTFTPVNGGTAVPFSTSSNQYVVGPHHFGFSNLPTGTIKAGNNFSATVTAYNGLATPTATPNFGNESPAEGVVLLSPSVCQPTGANTSFSFSGSVASFAGGGGSATATVSYGEVGNIDLNAKLSSGNYLNSSLAATVGNSSTSGTVCTGTSGAGNVGRFIPDHFETNVTQVSGVPMPCPAGLTCPTLYNGFVYSGQSFTTNVTAKNVAGVTTQNYDGTANTTPNFAKYNVILTAWDGLGSTTHQNPPAATPGSITNGGAISPSSFSKGTGAGTLIYTYGTTPTSPTNIYIRATEASGGDGVTSLKSPATSSVEGGVMMVSGRMKIASASGSQLLSLPISLTAQYWNGSNFITSSTDNNSALASSNILLGTYSYHCIGLPCVYDNWTTSVATLTNGTAINGSWAATLSKPSGTFTGKGSVQITGNSPTYLPGTKGLATFGTYTGNKNFIYMMENY